MVSDPFDLSLKGTFRKKHQPDCLSPSKSCLVQLLLLMLIFGTAVSPSSSLTDSAFGEDKDVDINGKREEELYEEKQIGHKRLKRGK